MPAKHTVVVGYCPDYFRSDLLYVFAPAAAGLFDSQWARIGSPTTMFAPNGTFYVPRELFPDSFRHEDIAAWEVEDQPNYALHGHSCRFRAVNNADAPVQVVRIECSSSDADSCRRVLEEGLDFATGRRDNLALVEFQDGIVVKVKFRFDPERPRHHFVSPGDFATPLDAWPAGHAPQTLSMNCDGTIRRIVSVSELPEAPERIDFSTLEEAFTSIRRAGGLGAHVSAQPAELRKAVERLQEVVASFSGPEWAARRARLGHFLEIGKEAAADRDRWEEFLAGHQLFRQALESIVTKRLDGLREEVRGKILEEETTLRARLVELESECGDWERLTHSAGEETKKIQQELEGLSGERAGVVADLERLQAERNSGKTQRQAAHPSENGAAHAETGARVTTLATIPAVPRISFAPDTTQELGEPLKNAKAALKRLEDNLYAIGILKVSARLLARETLVALSLGQMVLFRGSMAGPVAEVCSVSLVGGSGQIVPVPLGASQPFEVPQAAVGAPPAIMFEGINRSCFGTFGQAIGDILRGRAFGKVARTVPLFFGTIGDSPSFLPLGPDLIAFGPAFDTDYLSWDPKRAAGDVKGGLCEAGAWDLQEAAEPEDWADVIDELFPAANILWERQARAALRRLAALTDPERPGQPNASFLFGWIIPRLLASGVQVVSIAERFREGFLQEAVSADQRVKRLLQAHGVEVGK